jgi:hypothetical protein
MTPRQQIVSAQKLWADLLTKKDAPETEALRTARHEITLKLRTVLPNKKGFGNQYPWNSSTFDHYINR